MGVRGETSKARLLAAGRQELISGSGDLLANGLTVERVVARAGVSTQTFYNVYPRRDGELAGKGRFLDDLLRSVDAGAGRTTASAVDPEIDRQIDESGGDPRRVIRQLCQREFATVREDPATRLRHVVSAVATQHRAAVDAVRDQYRELSATAAEEQARLFERWHGRLRQPFTLEHLSVVLTALAEGLVIRARFDPESVPDSLFGDAAIALVASVVDVDSDQGHIDDMLAPLVRSAVREYHMVHADELPDDPERAIIAAAAAEFAQRGYANTTIEHICDTAGVDGQTLRRLFLSKAHIVVEGLKPAFGEVRRRTRSDRKLALPRVVVVERFLVRLADMIISHRKLADAMVLVASADTAQAPSNLILLKKELNFPELIVDVIDDGLGTGEFVTSGLPTIDVAAMLINNVIFRCLSRRTESAQDVATAISGVVLRGILADPIQRESASPN